MFQPLLISYLIMGLLNESMGTLIGEVTVDKTSYHILDGNKLPTYNEVQSAGEPNKDWLLCKAENPSFLLPDDEKFRYLEVRGVPAMTAVHFWDYDQWVETTNDFETGVRNLKIPQGGTGWIVATTTSKEIGKPTPPPHRLRAVTHKAILEDFATNYGKMNELKKSTDLKIIQGGSKEEQPEYTSLRLEPGSENAEIPINYGVVNPQ